MIIMTILYSGILYNIKLGQYSVYTCMLQYVLVIIAYSDEDFMYLHVVKHSDSHYNIILPQILLRNL